MLRHTPDSRSPLIITFPPSVFFVSVATKGLKAIVGSDPDRVGAGQWTVVSEQKNRKHIDLDQPVQPIDEQFAGADGFVYCSGPSNWAGPAEYDVYQDNLHGAFVFRPAQ